MSLKGEFNSAINSNLKLHPALKQNEIFLFRCLEEVLKTNTDSLVEEKHGSRGQVSFSFGNPKKNVQCEISDLLFIFLSESEIRYTFLQCKFDKKARISNLHASARQWELLSKRHIVHPVGANNNIPKDVLFGAKLNSAGTYGNFSSHNGVFDMNYLVASDLKSSIDVSKMSNSKNKIQLSFNPKNYGSTRTINGSSEVIGLASLDAFSLFSKAMLIGTPVSDGAKKWIGDLIFKLLNSDEGVNFKQRSSAIARMNKLGFRDGDLTKPVSLPCSVVFTYCPSKPIICVYGGDSSLIEKANLDFPHFSFVSSLNFNPCSRSCDAVIISASDYYNASFLLQLEVGIKSDLFFFEFSGFVKFLNGAQSAITSDKLLEISKKISKTRLII